MTNSHDDTNQLAPRPHRRWWRLVLLSGTGLGLIALVGAAVVLAVGAGKVSSFGGN